MINLIIAIIVSYLLGAIPFAFIVGKIKGIDIRRHGSGNVGATNATRVIGKVPGIIVLILDIAKGALAVTLIASFVYNRGVPIERELFNFLLAYAVIFGHVFNVFLGFKGGKGVATTAGVMFGLYPVLAIIAIAIWLISLYFIKYVSVSSLIAALSMSVSGAMMGLPANVVIFCITIFIAACCTHRSNIRRLVKGEEGRTDSMFTKKGNN